MYEKIREIKQTLDRSIFVGERLEKNLQNMTVTAIIVMMLGLVMTAVNLIQRQYSVLCKYERRLYLYKGDMIR